MNAKEVLTKHKISLISIKGKDRITRYTYRIQFYYPKGKKNTITGQSEEIVRNKVEAFFNDLSISFNDLYQRIINDNDYIKTKEKSFLCQIKRTYRMFYPYFIGYAINVIELDDIYVAIEKIKKLKSQNTVRLYLCYLKKMFRYAYEKGLIENNIASLVNSGSVKTYDRVPLSDDQVVEFVNAALSKYSYYIFAVYILTGIDPYYLVALSWKDIDFENNIIHIRKKMRDRNVTIPSLLNKSERFDMYIPSFVMDIFYKELTEQADEYFISKKELKKSAKPVFPHLFSKKHLSYASFGTRMDEFISRKLKVKYSRLDIRFAAAVLSLRAGCDLPSLLDIVGIKTAIKLFRYPQKYGCKKVSPEITVADMFDFLMDNHHHQNEINGYENKSVN